MIEIKKNVIDYYLEMCYNFAVECINCAKEFIGKPGIETCIWLCTIFVEKCHQFSIHYKNNTESKIRSLDICLNACRVCLNQCLKHANEACKKCIEACWLCMKECELILKYSNGNIGSHPSNSCLELAH